MQWDLPFAKTTPLLLTLSLLGGCSLLFESVDNDGVHDAGIDDAGVDAGGEEGFLAPPLTLTLGSAYAISSNVVWDGSDYRVVWESGVDVVTGEAYATTIGSGTNVRITTTGGNKPISIWNGNSLTIAWSDGRIPSGIYAGSYDTDNQIIGEESFVAEGLGGLDSSPALARTGTQVGATWVNVTGQTQVAFARLSNAGSLVDSAQIIQAEAALPTIAFGGNSYGMVWHGVGDSRNIFFRRILPSGLPASIVQLSDSSEVSLAPAVASDGTDFGVVWQEGSTATSSLYFVHVPASNTIVPPIKLTDSTALASLPDIAWSGEAYGVAWQDNRSGKSEIYFREFNGSGSPIGDELKISDGIGAAADVSLVHNGSEYAATWQMGSPGTQVIQFRRFRP